MKVFDIMEVVEAEQHAAGGCVALHLHNICFNDSPRCFRDAVVKRDECIGHLVDLNKERLVKTVRSLGVKVIFIDREDQPFQHIDLCGAPLRKLLMTHKAKLLTLGHVGSVKRLKEILAKFPGSRGWV